MIHLVLHPSQRLVTFSVCVKRAGAESMLLACSNTAQIAGLALPGPP